MLTPRSGVHSNAIVIFVFSFLFITRAHAATIVVDNAFDAGVGCTLREAVTSINNASLEVGCINTTTAEDFADNDQIHFSVLAVDLSNGELGPIREDIYFFGGDEGVTINGDGNNRLINISGDPGISVVLENMTLSGGNGTDGGAIYASGAVTILLDKSTVSGNMANDGGGIYTNGAELILSNSTVSGNSATNDGGGIAANNGTSVEIYNSTLSDNAASSGDGGGIYLGGLSANYVGMYNSIIANSSGADCYQNGSHTIESDAHNIIEDGTCSTLALNVDPNLGPLADNGGPTFTHALLSGSPAIDAGDNLICEDNTEDFSVNNFDQRGVVRPVGPACDIGSFEANVMTQYFIIPLPDGGAVIFNL